MLIGVDEAACTLGVSREAFTLELAQTRLPHGRRDRSAAPRLAVRGRTRWKTTDLCRPRPSLVDEALESADLNDTLKPSFAPCPTRSSTQPSRPRTSSPARSRNWIVRALLANINDQEDLNEQIEAAVTQAVKDSLEDRLRDLL